MRKLQVECRVCGQSYLMKKDGTVRRHRYEGLLCPGAGKLPKMNGTMLNELRFGKEAPKVEEALSENGIRNPMTIPQIMAATDLGRNTVVAALGQLRKVKKAGETMSGRWMALEPEAELEEEALGLERRVRLNENLTRDLRALGNDDLLRLDATLRAEIHRRVNGEEVARG